MQHQLVTTPARPSRAQIEPAALELLSRHSAGLLATARRYSATPEDAEDAYQRGVEILLTKAPTTTEDELLPWLRTVVKHEAFAVAKASGRALPTEEPLAREPDERAWTDDRAERYELLRVAAEAMAGLKPQEIRCLSLKAEGLSYHEICVATNWSYTKVWGQVGLLMVTGLPRPAMIFPRQRNGRRLMIQPVGSTGRGSRQVALLVRGASLVSAHLTRSV
jgi:RNA polymerase sigma factor (sigma-70 family)